MANVSGIAITIKAFLPAGKSLNEQHAALTLVTEAHASGDYSKVLAVAKIDDVKSEMKTRRVEDAPAPQTTTSGDEPMLPGTEGETTGAETAMEQAEEPAGDEDGKNVPQFLKDSRKGKAA